MRDRLVECQRSYSCLRRFRHEHVVERRLLQDARAQLRTGETARAARVRSACVRERWQLRIADQESVPLCEFGELLTRGIRDRISIRAQPCVHVATEEDWTAALVSLYTYSDLLVDSRTLISCTG